MYKDLETIYENMMPVVRIIKQPFPLDPLQAFAGEPEEEEEYEDEYEEDEEDEEDEDEDEECESCEDEEMTEAEEVEVAREILKHVSMLDDIAKEAMYKSYRKKIEHCSDKIRDLANEIIEKHGYDV